MLDKRSLEQIDALINEMELLVNLHNFSILAFQRTLEDIGMVEIYKKHYRDIFKEYKKEDLKRQIKGAGDVNSNNS